MYVLRHLIPVLCTCMKSCCLVQDESLQRRIREEETPVLRSEQQLHQAHTIVDTIQKALQGNPIFSLTMLEAISISMQMQTAFSIAIHVSPNGYFDATCRQTGCTWRT